MATQWIGRETAISWPGAPPFAILAFEGNDFIEHYSGGRGINPFDVDAPDFIAFVGERFAREHWPAFVRVVFAAIHFLIRSQQTA